MVEHQIVALGVEGSIPFTRPIFPECKNILRGMMVVSWAIIAQSLASAMYSVVAF